MVRSRSGAGPAGGCHSLHRPAAPPPPRRHAAFLARPPRRVPGAETRGSLKCLTQGMTVMEMAANPEVQLVLLHHGIAGSVRRGQRDGRAAGAWTRFGNYDAGCSRGSFGGRLRGSRCRVRLGGEIYCGSTATPALRWSRSFVAIEGAVCCTDVEWIWPAESTERKNWRYDCSRPDLAR